MNKPQENNPDVDAMDKLNSQEVPESTTPDLEEVELPVEETKDEQ